MNDDFESRVAALFNEQVDHELASRVSDGSPQGGRTGGRRPRPRWLPLLAAACVAAVAAGTYGTTQLLSSPAPAHHTNVVPGPTPSRVSATPSPDPIATGSPTTTVVRSSPSAGRSGSRSARPTHHAPATPSSQTSTHAPPAGPPATVLVIVRPVRAGGVPAPGWSVRTETDAVLCTQGPSPVAVDDDIRFCGSSASNTMACWRAADGAHVLCLSDPYGHTLRRLPLSGAFRAVTATAHRVPQALTTDDGTRYLVRNGGAWSEVRQHPSWIGYYTQRTTYSTNVYGPIGGTGIDIATSPWSVDVFAASGTGAGHRHRVVTAYELGTAP